MSSYDSSGIFEKHSEPQRTDLISTRTSSGGLAVRLYLGTTNHNADRTGVGEITNHDGTTREYS